MAFVFFDELGKLFMLLPNVGRLFGLFGLSSAFLLFLCLYLVDKEGCKKQKKDEISDT